MTATVSIILPCYNAARYLPHALMGIAEQTHKNFEVIVVDDCSTDATPELIKRPALPNLVYLRNDRNMGSAASRNRAMSVASGDFFACFDADDFMYPFRLRDQLLWFMDHDDYDLAGSQADVFGKVFTKYTPPQDYNGVINQMLLYNPMIQPTIMFRRRLFDEGLFKYDSSLVSDEDYAVWATLLPRVKCGNLGWATIKYRIHARNLHRHPAGRTVKAQIIRQFCRAYNYQPSEDLVSALVAFQTSFYITFDQYQVLRNYALEAEQKHLPKLGWLHNWIVSEKHYHLFMDYYMSKQWS